jgi:hypothetical protein
MRDLCLWMFMDWLWIGYGLVMDNSSTQSLNIWRYNLAVGQNRTRIREKVWCRRCRVCVLRLKSLGVDRLKRMIPRDLVDVLRFGMDVLRDLCLWIGYGCLWITPAPNLSTSGVTIWP